MSPFFNISFLGAKNLLFEIKAKSILGKLKLASLIDLKSEFHYRSHNKSKAELPKSVVLIIQEALEKNREKENETRQKLPKLKINSQKEANIKTETLTSTLSKNTKEFKKQSERLTPALNKIELKCTHNPSKKTKIAGYSAFTVQSLCKSKENLAIRTDEQNRWFLKGLRKSWATMSEREKLAYNAKAAVISKEGIGVFAEWRSTVVMENDKVKAKEESRKQGETEIGKEGLTEHAMSKTADSSPLKRPHNALEIFINEMALANKVAGLTPYLGQQVDYIAKWKQLTESEKNVYREKSKKGSMEWIMKTKLRK